MEGRRAIVSQGFPSRDIRPRVKNMTTFFSSHAFPTSAKKNAKSPKKNLFSIFPSLLPAHFATVGEETILHQSTLSYLL